MNTNIVYVVTSIYSPYKEDVDDSSVENYVFSTFDKAQEIMMKIAKSKYNNFKEYDSENEDLDIVEENNYGSFFYASNDSILYGEDKDYGVGYRRAWGLVKIEKVEINSF